MIGEKITLEGYGAYNGEKRTTTVVRITQTMAVVRQGAKDPANPRAGEQRYSLKTGTVTGGYGYSGFEIPADTLAKLREQKPSKRYPPNI